MREDIYNQLQNNYSRVPVYRWLDCQTSELELFLKMRSFKQRNFNNQIEKDLNFFLHSARNGRYSIIAYKISDIWIGLDKGLKRFNINNSKKTFYKGNPLLELEKQFKKNTAPKLDIEIPFYGGFIGYLSYEVIRHIENIPDYNLEDLGMPLFIFADVVEGYVYDHLLKKIFLYSNYPRAAKKNKDNDYQKKMSRLNELEDVVNYVNKDDFVLKNSVDNKKLKINYSFSQADFEKASNRIIEYIKAGDVFQVNLSLRQEVNYNDDPLKFYNRLVKVNPSPYMAYIEIPQMLSVPKHSIASCSPELLVKKRNSLIETRPIAGTRARGKNDALDEKLISDLLSNEKELAEHIMLVDLERNDLGRVAKYGSVEVNELFALEKYSHVMHIVSNVRAEIKEDKNIFDLIKAVFPGGTITGAPKIRTMEIIEELEPVRRGLYTGSIGWLGFNGDMELNIVIRTAIFLNDKAYVQAGAGIVYDSIASREYKESLKKALVLLEILIAEREVDIVE